MYDIEKATLRISIGRFEEIFTTSLTLHCILTFRYIFFISETDFRTH